MKLGGSGLARIADTPQIAGAQAQAPTASAGLEQRLRALQAEYDALREGIAAQLRKRDARYARLEAAFRAELTRHTDQMATLETRHRTELEALQNRIAGLSREAELASAQSAELAGLRAYAGRLEAELHRVLSSTSWHVTGPFRGLTERHPIAAARLRRLLGEHPALGRAAMKVARTGWRLMTLRRPAGVVQASSFTQPSLPDPAAVSLESLEPGGDADPPALPGAGRRGALCVMPADAAPRTGRTVLFVAAGDPSDGKGLEDFLRLAWPIIRKHDPAAELIIAGSPEGAALPDGVRAIGRVDDLAPLYAAARVVINPAIAGPGLEIATAEALCHLRPIVCWPAGADGLPAEARRFCTVVSDWFLFARQVLDLLEDEDAALDMRRARDDIARAFSPEHVPLGRAEHVPLGRDA